MTVQAPEVVPGEGTFAWAASPLALLIQDGRTNQLLGRLAGQLEALRRAERDGVELAPLVIRTEDLAYAADTWERAVREGERRLYDIATLMAWQLLGTRALQLVARIIAGPRTEQAAGHRIVIEELLDRQRLTRTVDSTLAAEIASRYRYRNGRKGFGKLYARASFLEFRPLETTRAAAATRVLTRVKVEDQIWNKVCDAFFDIDALVRRDKILNRQSKYIKDVFGIKVLTVDRDASYRVSEALNSAAFADEDLDQLGVAPCGPGARGLELIESKDYLALPEDQKKRTGWEAIKNVYRWCGQIFEVQVQTEANYYLEAMDLSDNSHRTFEMQRDELRRELEDRIHHYKEFRAVLKALFRRRWRTGRPRLPDWVKLES